MTVQADGNNPTRAASVRTRDAEVWTADRAHRLVTRLLRELPCRLAHSLRTGAQARLVLTAVPPDDAELLVTAALLHDIGYAPALQRTKFHPLDGAWFLLESGAPERLAALVAHHSEAWLLARPRGLSRALSEFPREQGAVADALAYADMTAGPCGQAMTITDRLADIARRHADEPAGLRAGRAAREPLLRAAADRVIAAVQVYQPALPRTLTTVTVDQPAQ